MEAKNSTKKYSDVSSDFLIPSNRIRGFTLVELLIYAAGMIILLGVIITLIYNIYNIYRDATIGPRVDRIGISLIDRITKDVRTGISVDLSQSSLNVPAGSLTLNAQIGPTLITKNIRLNDGRLTYQETGLGEYDLTPDNVTISRFLLNQINTPISDALRFEIEIMYNTRNGIETKQFDGVAVLRHSYE